MALMKQYFTKYLSIETEMEEIHYCIQCSNLGGGIRHCAHPEECGQVISELRPKLIPGDKFLDSSLGICVKGKEDPWIEWQGGRTNLAIRAEHRKVQLFLCDRDIQPGDRFNSANGTGFLCSRVDPEKIYSIGGLQSDIEEVPHSKVDAYKVVGEISPDATWVTDRMELNENQVRYNKCGNMLGQDPKDAFYYLIKCPTCKTFH